MSMWLPQFACPECGSHELRQFRAEYQRGEMVHPNVGFLTFPSLTLMFERLGLSGRFVRSRGSLGCRARRELARIQLRRAPPAFGVWIAR